MSKIIDLADSHYRYEADRYEVGLIPINTCDINPDNNSICLDIYSFNGDRAEIDIEDANNHNVEIDIFHIIAHNFLELKFRSKDFFILFKKLVFNGAKIDYLASANVKIENLEILTYEPEIRLCPSVLGNILIKKVANEDEEIIKHLLQSVTIIPGSGEYALDPDLSNVVQSLVDLKNSLPNVKWIAPVVSWFATSLDIKTCNILPGIDAKYKHPDDIAWNVAKYTVTTAHTISIDLDDIVNYGGSINDASVISFLELAKNTHHLNIIFYPLIMVDSLSKPWRGRITGEAEDIEKFYQEQYRPFIIHYANLVKDKVDAFIIGSELVGLTKVHTSDGRYLFVESLINLAHEIKLILGPSVKVTYAADWSEYHSSDGINRPLDHLWASRHIDFVGIDAYFPLTCSRSSRISVEEIKKGWESGEGWEYYIVGDNQTVAFDPNELWNQWKNLKYWWESEHWVGSDKTLWLPKMKPIWFTEFGFPSIDKATNKPNVFYDPKSTDGGVPTHSNGKPDFAIQARALRATLEYWQNSEFVQNMICWTWDARGSNWHDNNKYADGRLWEFGHWIDDKIGRKEGIILSSNINAQTLTIKAPNLTITDVATIEVTSLFIDVQGDLVIKAKVTDRINCAESEDTTEKSITYKVYPTKVTVNDIAIIKTGGKCLFEATKIRSDKLLITARSLEFACVVTKDEYSIITTEEEQPGLLAGIVGAALGVVTGNPAIVDGSIRPVAE